MARVPTEARDFTVGIETNASSNLQSVWPVSGDQEASRQGLRVQIRRFLNELLLLYAFVVSCLGGMGLLHLYATMRIRMGGRASHENTIYNSSGNR